MESETLNGGMTVAGGRLNFYSMYSEENTELPCNAGDLKPYVAALRECGPVTTIPLPHFVHSSTEGWRKKAAKATPTVHYVNSREGAVSLSSHLPNWANKPFLGILQ